MKKKLPALLMLAVLFTLIVIPRPASASEYTFDVQRAKLTTSDDVLIMTKSTSKYDEVWEKAGVTDPKAKLDELKNSNTLAVFYDPATKCTVNFSAKQSQDIVQKFSFDFMTDEEIIDYIKKDLDADPDHKLYSNPEITTEISVEEFNGKRFFRLFIDSMASTDDMIQKTYEYIYGIIINAQIIEFECCSMNGVRPDESFIRSLVQNLSFTPVYTREEYDEIVHNARVKLMIIAICFFGLIIFFIVFAIVRKRVNKKRIKRIAEETAEFHNKRKAGSIPDDLPVRYTCSCTYNEQTITADMTYQTWIRFLPVLIPCALLYIYLMYSMFIRNNTFIALITLGAGIYLLYSHYTRLERIKESMKKHYAANPEVTVRFRDDYFDVLGLGAISEYTYLQVTSVGHYNGYTYVYIGDEKAIYMLDKNTTPGSAAELRAFVKGKKKTSLSKAKK